MAIDHTLEELMGQLGKQTTERVRKREKNRLSNGVFWCVIIFAPMHQIPIILKAEN